jgi:hypothetical protein
VPFDISAYQAQMALEDDVMLAAEDIGFDFWWIDWQQGQTGHGAPPNPKKNPTIWTAHMRSTDKQVLIDSYMRTLFSEQYYQMFNK